jgi:hypothetical protein
MRRSHQSCVLLDSSGFPRWFSASACTTADPLREHTTKRFPRCIFSSPPQTFLHRRSPRSNSAHNIFKSSVAIDDLPWNPFLSNGGWKLEHGAEKYETNPTAKSAVLDFPPRSRRVFAAPPMRREERCSAALCGALRRSAALCSAETTDTKRTHRKNQRFTPLPYRRMLDSVPALQQTPAARR